MYQLQNEATSTTNQFVLNSLTSFVIPSHFIHILLTMFIYSIVAARLGFACHNTNPLRIHICLVLMVKSTHPQSQLQFKYFVWIFTCNLFKLLSVKWKYLCKFFNQFGIKYLFCRFYCGVNIFPFRTKLCVSYTQCNRKVS